MRKPKIALASPLQLILAAGSIEGEIDFGEFNSLVRGVWPNSGWKHRKAREPSDKRKLAALSLLGHDARNATPRAGSSS